MLSRNIANQWREFHTNAVGQWLGCTSAKTLWIEPGSPWENGYNQSFNGKPRDECLLAPSANVRQYSD